MTASGEHVPPPADNALTTYRYLRLAVPAILIMLIVSVGLQWWTTGHSCWQTSISAYFFTPARGIFVGTLCALGACLIAYRGNTAFEDAALNSCGVMAALVAFVPTARESICDVTTFSQPNGVLVGAASTPLDGAADILAGVKNNFLAFMIVVILAQIIFLTLSRQLHGTLGRKVLIWGGVLNVIISVSAVVWYQTKPQTIERYGHGVAAILLVAGIASVMWNNYRDAKRKSASGTTSRFAETYRVIAGVMIVSLVALFAIHWINDGWRHWLLVLEILVFLEFLIFWCVQTAELWDFRTREELARAR